MATCTGQEVSLLYKRMVRPKIWSGHGLGSLGCSAGHAVYSCVCYSIGATMTLALCILLPNTTLYSRYIHKYLFAAWCCRIMYIPTNRSSLGVYPFQNRHWLQPVETGCNYKKPMQWPYTSPHAVGHLAVGASRPQTHECC